MGLSVSLLAGAPATRADIPVVTRFTYDAGDHVTSITDPRGLTTTYAYDGLGQKRQQVSPDTGTTTYSYDSYGRLASVMQAGYMITYGYDGIGRRTSASAGGVTQTFAYDNCTHGAGRLCSASDATGKANYVYSPEGWVTGRGFAMGGTSYSLGYSYNALGQVTAVVYPDGTQALYTYANGVVSTVQAKINGVVSNVATGVTYQPANAAMAQWTSGNGLTNALAYDVDGRLTSINVPGVQNLNFTYDAANRITAISNGGDAAMSGIMGYDAMSRLVAVRSAADNEDFAYDANGNRTRQNLNGASVAVIVNSGNNQVTQLSGASNVSYGYGARGNIATVSGASTFAYDGFNRLSTAGSASYYVSPEGQRLRKTVNGVSTYFAPDAAGPLLAENPSGGWTDYIWLNGRLIARVNAGQILAIHDDQVGRPEVMTNASRNVIWRARNFVFDRTVTQNTSVPLNLGFPGQYYDAESGLWNNGFRDYSPSLGRYIESDPIGLAGGINIYAYVLGNPLSNIDPSGLTTWHVSMFGGSAPVFGPLGGTYAHFQATAKVPGKDCVAFVEGNVYGADGGFAPGIGFSGSQMDMDDGMDTFNPYALQGQFSSVGAQVLIGAGPAYGATRMGQAYSGWGWSFNGGIAFGSTAAFGRSVVTSVVLAPLH